MPVIEGPSIWDYIAKAGEAGITSYQEAKDKVRADALQNAGLLNQLFNTGAVDSSTLGPAVSKIPGMQKVKIQPNVPEKQRTPGTPEYVEQQAELGANQQKVQKADIIDRWSKGAPVTEKEALLANLPTDQDIRQMREAKSDPLLDRAAKQYIDSYILSKGGRLTPQEGIEVAATAYQSYIRDYQAAGLGTLSPAEQQNAQRFFAGHALDRMIEQRKLDIEDKAAENRGSFGIQPVDRMFAQLTSLEENNRRTLDNFLSANMGIDKMASKYAGKENLPPPEGPPALFKGGIARYNALIQRERDIQTAQGQLRMGIVPEKFAELLTPPGGGQSTGSSVDAAKVAQGIQIIKSKQGSLSDLPRQVKLGRLTQAESDAIQAAVLAAPTKPAGKPAAKPATKPTSSIEGTAAPSGTMFKGPSRAQQDSASRVAATADSAATANATRNNKALAQARYNRFLALYGPNSPMTISAKEALGGE